MKRLQFFFFFILLLPISPVYSSLLFAVESALSRYDLDNPVSELKLAPPLFEISGIVVAHDGRLFAHNDEEGTVFELDAATGRIIKRFYLLEAHWYGNDRILADFEDIALVGKQFYMVTSGGALYSFAEGEDGAEVKATKHETFLSEFNNVEGLCYDKETNALLLACKEYAGQLSLKQLFLDRKKSAFRFKAVYSYPLDAMLLDTVPRFVIDGEQIQRKSGRKKFKPSAIERHPETGTFFVLGSGILVELSPRGEVIAVVPLKYKKHKGGAEGLAFTAKNELLISYEGDVKKPGALRRFPMRE